MHFIQQNNLRMRQFIANINEKYNNEFNRRDSNSRVRRRTKAEWLFSGMRPEIWLAMDKNMKDKDQIDDHTWLQICESAQDAEWLVDFRANRQSDHYCWDLSYVDYVDPNHFQIDRDGFVRVYTDGACFSNGYEDAAGGVGVWFNQNHPKNVSEPLAFRQYGKPMTSNQTEIEAAIAAMNALKAAGFKKAVLFTDSNFVVQAMTLWIFNWLINGWTKYDGSEVSNKQEFRNLLRASEGLKIKWVHVDKYNEIVGNRKAHDLAQKGAKKYAELYNSGSRF